MTTRVGIIGLGLMGGSLGLALKKNSNLIVCFGQDIQSKNVSYCINENIIDKELTEQKIPQMDFIIIAVPIKATPSVIEKIYPFLNKKKTIISDMGSTKTFICKHFRENYPDINFIAGHPMTGGEKSGARFATADLYENQNYILIDNPDDYHSFAKSNLQKLKNLLQTTNCQFTCLSAAEHDRITALTSHLPHLASFSLMNIFANRQKYNKKSKTSFEQLQELIGPGFLDFTRISACEPSIWLDIFQTNRQNITQLIDVYIDQLEEYKNALKNKDNEKIDSLMQQARSQRKNLDYT